MTTLPAGRLIKIEFEILLPVDASHDQIEEWARFEALKTGTLASSNPLSGHELEGFTGDISLTDTGMQGKREEYDHRHEGNSTYYKVRYIRTPA